MSLLPGRGWLVGWPMGWPMGWRMGWRMGLLSALLAGLAGCALQPPAATPLPTPSTVLPGAWDSLGADLTDLPGSAEADPQWWRSLDAPGLDALIGAAEQSAPSLAQAVARIEQARALAVLAGAAGAPQLQGSLSANRSNTQSLTGGGQNSLGASLNLSWEMDLFGRVRHSAAAAQRRLDARQADAQQARLALQAQVADTLVQRHACAWQVATLVQDVVSRETTLALTRARLAVGFAAPMEVDRALTSVGQTRQALAAGRGQCQQLQLALSALTGLAMATLDKLLGQPQALQDRPLPRPPTTALALPARVLAQHPALRAALATADAAVEDIGGARAARWPSLNLAALLGRNWIQVGSRDGYLNTWSNGPVLTLPLLDGGSSAANVRLAQARLDDSLAAVQQTLRTVVQEVEVALSQLDTAQQVERHAADTVAAAQRLFVASDAGQRGGRLSLFELEDARNTLTGARSALVAAQRDRARAWVALVKATGNGLRAEPPVAAVQQR